MNDKAKQDASEAEDQQEFPSFADEVWQKLSRIKLDDHVEWLPKTGKRPSISYLPWHTAWTLLKRNFPASVYFHHDDMRHPDETVEVTVTVHIRRSHREEQSCFARLAVMDNYFNPIANPTARQINDSRQRVLVKALAFAGLGLHLWGDDNVPVGELEDPIDDEQVAEINKLLEASKSDTESFLKWAGVDAIEDIPVERYLSAVKLLESKIKRNKTQS